MWKTVQSRIGLGPIEQEQIQDQLIAHSEILKTERQRITSAVAAISVFGRPVRRNWSTESFQRPKMVGSRPSQTKRSEKKPSKRSSSISINTSSYIRIL